MRNWRLDPLVWTLGVVCAVVAAGVIGWLWAALQAPQQAALLVGAVVIGTVVPLAIGHTLLDWFAGGEA